MFWSKKKKLPITEADKLWVDEALNWFKQNFGQDHYMALCTVTPTKGFYDRDFTGIEEDAYFALDQTRELMSINDSRITLDFFSDAPIEMPDGTILSTPADEDGQWESASGTYAHLGNEIIVSLEKSQLENPISLIATIAHELSHLILLGEGRIEENDEPLTDLCAIVYGFGIFIGNSRFNFSAHNTSWGSSWQSSSQGYLPEQLIAYAMAQLAIERDEEIDYCTFMDKNLLHYFEQCMDYLKGS